MRVQRNILCVAVLMALLSAFGYRPPDSLSEDPTTPVAEDDKLMNKAIAEAKHTVDEFIEVLRNPSEDQWGFAVKVPITDGEQVEHFWLNDVIFTDGVFTGTINNDPRFVRNVKFGQKYSVNKSDISDWLYMEGTRMMGNKTLRALFPHMSKQEVEEIKRRFQWE